MIYIILAKWGDEKEEKLLIQHYKQDECYRMYCALVKDAQQQKTKVAYRMDELEGNIKYTPEEIESINKEKAKLDAMARAGNTQAQQAVRSGKIIT